MPKAVELDLKLGDNLSKEKKLQLQKLFCTYSSILSWNDNDNGRTKLVKHFINTDNAAPIKSQPYRIPVAMHEIVNQHIDKMLENDIIEPSRSPWSSPIMDMLVKN